MNEMEWRTHEMMLKSENGLSLSEKIRQRSKVYDALYGGIDNPANYKDEADWLVHKFGCSRLAVLSTPRDTWCDVLYPYSLAVAYHLVRNNVSYINEKTCDDLLKEFVDRQSPTPYVVEFTKAANPNVKRLIMYRILLASFGFGGLAKDNIPSHYKKMACDYLGVPEQIKLTPAQCQVEEAYRSSSVEDQILGRVGYLLIWKKLITPSLSAGALEF